MILKCLTRANPPAKILWIYSMEDSSSIRNNIVIYDNQLFILNFSRTTPANYQCIADNGIPPRDTRTSHLVPASKTRRGHPMKNESETKDRESILKSITSIHSMTQLSFFFFY